MCLANTATAQKDTVRSAHREKSEAARPDTASREFREESGEYKKEDRIVIERSKLPDALRQTLEETDQYRGWDHSTIYFDRSTRQYILTLTDVNSTRTYKFDENGKPVTDTSSPKKDDQ